MGNQDQDNDMSKAQSAQQPQASQKDRSEEQRESQSPTSEDSSRPGTGQAGFGETQSDTRTDQRSDTEGSSATGEASGSSGFVGAEGNQDTSSELVEDADKKDFAKDGQGSAE